MVPQQGVPKYDFLRKMLRGSLDSLDSALAGMLTQPICQSCVVLSWTGLELICCVGKLGQDWS